jgi:hypothetical protein
VPTQQTASCDLPERLPSPSASDAAPEVSGEGTLLFTSALYRRSGGGVVVLRDDPFGDWAMGLWFRPAGDSTPRLLTSTERGMVIPLALSSDTDQAVVWWLPARNPSGERSCPSGIYLLSMAHQDSRLLVTGDWTVDTDEDVPYTWQDPAAPFLRRAYRIPEAGFSDDGTLVALVDRDRIGIYETVTGAPAGSTSASARTGPGPATGRRSWPAATT